MFYFLPMYLRILEKHVSNIITLIQHIITGISLGCMCQTSGTWQTIAPSHYSEIYFTQVRSALHAKQEKIKGNRLQYDGRFGSRSLHKAETDQESTFHQQMLQLGKIKYVMNEESIVRKMEDGKSHKQSRPIQRTKWIVSLINKIILQRIKHVKSSENNKQELFTRKKNGETRTKRALDYFRMPKL